MAATLDTPAPPTLSSSLSQSTNVLSISTSLQPLTVSETIFVNHYLSNGQNGRAAYLAGHPGIKLESAEVGAARMLGSVRVQEEIAHRLEVTGVVTKASLASDLVKYKTWAEQKEDYTAAATIVMDHAKLAGYLIDKREVTTLTGEQTSAVRSFVESMLSSERLPKSTNGHGDTKSASPQPPSTIQTPTPPPA